MKTYFSFLLFQVVSLVSFSQEFKTFDNGMIYSSIAINKLKELVGEKNEEFRTCDFKKSYVSFEQTKGQIFTINSPNMNSLENDLKNNISLEDFIKKYGIKNNKGTRLVTKFQKENYKGEQVVSINEHPKGNRVEILVSKWKESKFDNWILDSSNKKYVEVVYLEEDFFSKVLPERFSKMIQYSECLIDTTSQIFNKQAVKNNRISYKALSRKKQEEFIDFINRKFNVKKPKLNFDKKMSKQEIKKVWDSIAKWKESKKEFVKMKLSKEREFCNLLNEAYQEALVKRSSTDEFEVYVRQYLAPENALLLKRNRVVVGQCSMDNSPRVHAMNIAQLAGETVNWDIFLRAHLNVLNDNVNRVSDGSWAWNARKTYIKELEELNINVPDLIFGIGLRAKNVPDGHYFGSIARMGRAISESKDIEIFKSELLQLIENKELDDFNRLLMFYLYDNMMYSIDMTEEKTKYIEANNAAVNLLPQYLRPVN